MATMGTGSGSDQRRRVVVVANRLPVSWNEATKEWDTSPGGLVSALTPILQQTAGTWVGWSGTPGMETKPFSHDEIEQWPVNLTNQEYLDFYVGFCNGTLWPLYHDSIRPPQFHRHWWGPYHQVNERFASAASAVLQDTDIAWVQDYQLQLVPAMIRRQTRVARIGFYLHIPFPPIELFSTLPWRSQIVEGLLGSDVLAFQSRSSRSNFAHAARRFAGASGTNERLRWNGRQIDLQVAPIGIDAGGFEKMAGSEDTEALSRSIRAELGDPDTVILGVDRLDYTKGIDHRMRAVRTLLDTHPRLRGNVVLVQIAVPSREDVVAYQEIRQDIEGLVGRVNGDFAEVGRPPIHYLYRSLPVEELVAHYRAADLMLVTPLRDGMNLVAKEYVATRYDNTGVLVLSEFAGAAEQLSRALLVNPHDLDGLAGTIHKGIEMEPGEAARRMRSLRRSVRSHDVFWWAEQCLKSLGI